MSLRIGGIHGNFGYGNIGFGNYGIGNTNSANFNPNEKEIAPGHKPACECETCKRRKYKDGSDENDVSFQSAQHISPENSGARVMAHEKEHVANAYEKASKAGGKVLQASVTLQTSVCPECGRVYVSGGLTKTRIMYPNEENPYQKERKAQDHAEKAGSKVDLAV